MNKTRNFTLAEVLITLVIIGIIAVICVPLLYAQYTEQEKISKVKKMYSTLANVMTRVKADGGNYIFNEEIDDTAETINKWFDNYLKMYLITTKICYQKAGCWSFPTYKMSGDKPSNLTSYGIGGPVVTAVLNDGMYINVDRCAFATYGVTISGQKYGIIIYFDINGDKKPNTIGKDIFLVVAADDGIIPAGRDWSETTRNKDCSSSGSGYSCIQKYLAK